MPARTAHRPPAPAEPDLGGYHLIEVLEQAPSGTTWLARSRAGRVGIKLPPRADDESALRLLREGEILNQINDVHVVRLVDQGRAKDGRPFLVLEWLDGEPLEGHLRRMGPLPVPRALALIRQVLVGLRTLHARRLVHRGLTLASLFLARQGGGEVLKLIDLGAVALRGSATGPAPCPTPEGGPADPRGDLYAVGLMLYELVSGRPPFAEGRRGDPTGGLRWQHTHAQPPRPDVALPDGLWNVLLTLLEKRPEDRYRSVDAVLEALDDLGNRPSFQRFCRPGGPDVPSDPEADELEQRKSSIISTACNHSQGPTAVGGARAVGESTKIPGTWRSNRGGPLRLSSIHSSSARKLVDDDPTWCDEPDDAAPTAVLRPFARMPATAPPPAPPRPATQPSLPAVAWVPMRRATTPTAPVRRPLNVPAPPRLTPLWVVSSLMALATLVLMGW